MENELKFMHFVLISPPVIFLGVLLAHFFGDSDRQRGFAAKLRAKYILNKKGPKERTNNSPDDREKDDVFRDCLRFRLLKIHFGIINLLVLLALGFLIAIFFSMLFLCCPKRDAFVIACYFPMAAFCFILQYGFLEQSRATSRRINDLNTLPIDKNGSFAKQSQEIIQGISQDDKSDCFYKITNWTVISLIKKKKKNQKKNKYPSGRVCIMVDVFFIVVLYILTLLFPLILG